MRTLVEALRAKGIAVYRTTAALRGHRWSAGMPARPRCCHSPHGTSSVSSIATPVAAATSLSFTRLLVVLAYKPDVAAPPTANDRNSNALVAVVRNLRPHVGGAGGSGLAMKR